MFLAGTRDDIVRWLPPPQWEPAWRSEAVREIGNCEAGPAGAWGEDTIRTVYAGAALYLDTILRCIQGLADALTPQTTPYVVNAIARAAMEAGAQLWWLLEPGIGARRRVARFWLARASGAHYLDETVHKIDPAAPTGTYGETPAMVRAAIDGLGLSYSERQFRNGRWSRSCEGETSPATPPVPRHSRQRSACQPRTPSTPRRRTPNGTRSSLAFARNLCRTAEPSWSAVLTSWPSAAPCLPPQGSRSCPPTGRSGSSGEPQGWRSSAITLAGPKT